MLPAVIPSATKQHRRQPRGHGHRPRQWPNAITALRRAAPRTSFRKRESGENGRYPSEAFVSCGVASHRLIEAVPLACRILFRLFVHSPLLNCCDILVSPSLRALGIGS